MREKPKFPIFSDPTELRWFAALPGETFNVRVDSELTGYGFAIAEVIVDPQCGPPLHVHHDTDEVIYVVDGIIDFVCDERHFRSGPGGMVVIPKGSCHAFRNFGDRPARLLGFLPTGGLEQFFIKMNGSPPSELPLLAALHHLEIVGPQIGEPKPQ
jgi:mannose-6-phosphate isomerase-like protein (cupin superfamily)